MIRKLRIACPVAVLCLAVLICGVIAWNANARASGQEAGAAVTYTADAWTDGMAGPAMAQETSAVMPVDEGDELAAVPATERRDSGYELTDEERVMVERIVMCEAGGEGERGQMMVAQCILEGMLRYNYSIEAYIKNYKVMLTSYSNVTDEVRQSVSKVFDNGERVVEDRADLWYNPAITPSQWHEEQEYVITIGSHRFFWMRDDSTT